MNVSEDEQRERLWAVFSNDEEGYCYQISNWMTRQRADNMLTVLHESGESSVFLASKGG